MHIKQYLPSISLSKKLDLNIFFILGLETKWLDYTNLYLSCHHLDEQIVSKWVDPEKFTQSVKKIQEYCL